MDYYRRFCGDYVRKTLCLTLAEDGAYSRLLDHQYATEQPIHGEAEACSIARARTKNERKIVLKVLFKYFRLTDSGWINPRFEKELSYAESKRKQASYAGKQSAKVRTDVQRTFNGRSTISDNQTTRQPETSNSTTEKEAPTVPECIPVSVWLAFVEMRKKIRHPLTVYAGELIRKKLQTFKEEGLDPIEIIENSIRNGWRDVFAPSKGGNANGKHESFEERRQRKSAEAIREVGDRAREILHKMDSAAGIEPSEQRPNSRIRRSIN